MGCEIVLLAIVLSFNYLNLKLQLKEVLSDCVGWTFKIKLFF